MNKHVERMKTALNGYYNALKATDEKIRRNNETYQPAAAQAENQRLQTAIEQARRNAEAEIRSAVEEGQKSIDAWATPDGKQITDDAKLLQYGVSIEDFRKLADRYRDNYSMSALLQRYADGENEKIRANANETGHIPSELYPAWEIRSAENRKGAYQNFGKSALDLISAMHARPGFGTGLQSDTLKHSVETFGESATPNTAAIADLL